MNITSRFFLRPSEAIERSAMSASGWHPARGANGALRVLFLLIMVAAFSQWGLSQSASATCVADAAVPNYGSLPPGMANPPVVQGTSNCYSNNSTFPFRTTTSVDGEGNIFSFTTSGTYVSQASVTGPNQFHAETSVGITDSPKQYIGDDNSGNPYAVTNPQAGYFESVAEDNSTDVVTVHGPAGTPIQLKVTASVDGAVSYNQCGTSEDYLNNASVGGDFALGNASDGVAYFDFEAGTQACGRQQDRIPLNSPYSQVITVNDGTSLYMSGALDTDMEVMYGWLPQHYSPNGPIFVQSMIGEAVASDTGSLYIDPLTPGAYLTSDSGADYSTPASTTTPEPASLLLLGTGLLGLAWMLRHKGGILRQE